jgi:hypothetical protein
MIHVLKMSIFRGKDEIIAVGETHAQALAAMREQFDACMAHCEDPLTWDQWEAEYGESPDDYHGMWSLEFEPGTAQVF